jgi:hypothetical protein
MHPSDIFEEDGFDPELDDDISEVRVNVNGSRNNKSNL